MLESWTSGSSSAASNSGEKWATHITAANMHPGHDREGRDAHDPRVQDRQDPAAAGRRCDDTRSSSVIGADEGDRGAPRRARAGCAGPCGPRTAPCRSARCPTAGRTPSASLGQGRSRPSAGAAPGWPGWAAFTRRTAHDHQPSATAIASVGQRLERPAEQQDRERRRLRRGRAVGRRRRRPRPARPPGTTMRDGDAARRPIGRASRGIVARTGASGHRAPMRAPQTNDATTLRVSWPRSDRRAPTRPSPTSARRPVPVLAALAEDLDVELPRRAPLHHRARRSSCWCAIIVVGVVASPGWSAVAARRIVESLYPPIAVTDQGAEIRDALHVVFLIAAAIFFVVEGLIVWTVIRYRRRPRRRRAAAADPRQRDRRDRLDGRPDDHRRVHVRHLVADAQRRSTRRSRRAGHQDPGGRRPVPVAVRLPARRLRPQPGVAGPAPLYPEFVPTGADGGLTVPAGRTVQLYLDQPGRHPRLLRAAVPVQARRGARAG